MADSPYTAVLPREKGARRREQAREALLAAASATLEERPWSEVSIDTWTSAAGMSRTAFYQHFSDRNELLLTLARQLSLKVDAGGSEWIRGGADPMADLERSLRMIIDLWVEHGRLFQAVSDAASADSAVAAAWTGLIERIIADTAAGIRRDRRHGLTSIEDPESVATALTWMNERYLLKSFGRHPLSDPAVVQQTLTRIWLRTIYDLPSASS